MSKNKNLPAKQSSVKQASRVSTKNVHIKIDKVKINFHININLGMSKNK